jgi:DnaK suppressor protein
MDAQTARQKLLEEQESLAALRQQSEEARAPVTLDQQAVGRLSRMDALQKQNMELATEQRRQQRLQIIASALSAHRSWRFRLLHLMRRGDSAAKAGL